MATLQEFLRTGLLGPISLGMSPTAVMAELGPPEDTSRKMNPLLLKFGGVELTFWRNTSERQQRLSQIVVSFQTPTDRTPGLLRFVDWPQQAPTAAAFHAFLSSAMYPPLDTRRTSDGIELVFPSGVIAFISDALLRTLRASQKERKGRIPSSVSSEQEPTLEQIIAMLHEASVAKNVGANRAALLISWAALEATLRRVAIARGVQTKLGVQASYLLSELLSAGVLTSEETKELEHVRQVRMASAHGLTPAEVGVETLGLVDQIARRLLATFDS